MFLIFGISPLKKAGKQITRHHCPRCNDIRNFQENQIRNYLSFFFIPIIPISKSHSLFICPTCGYTTLPELVNEIPKFTNDLPSEFDKSGRVVILCQRCDGPMYIPLKEQRQMVTCPHCAMEFVVKGIKGIIPNAMVQFN
jgi:ssDNA-binding Zn-finger/Zn-ribbon topoisomerase 1